MSSNITEQSRRKFLQFMAASPLFASSALAGDVPAVPVKPADPIIWAPLQSRQPDQVAEGSDQRFRLRGGRAAPNVPPAHFGYMASGIDDEVTLRANREGFLKFQLRPRRLVDVSKVDMSVDILGVKYPSPIVIAPVGGHRLFHPEGEIAAAKAAKAGNHLQILSTVSHHRRRGRHGGRGAPIWYQLYATNKLGRGEGAGDARREGRLPGGRGDGRPLRRPQSGNPVPAAPDRHPRVQRLPRSHQPDADQARTRDVSGHRPDRACTTRSRRR